MEINLDGIGADDFPVEPFRELQGEPAFAGAGGARYHYYLLSLVFGRAGRGEEPDDGASEAEGRRRLRVIRRAEAAHPKAADSQTAYHFWYSELCCASARHRFFKIIYICNKNYGFISKKKIYSSN